MYKRQPPCIQLGARWLNRRNAKARTKQGCCRIPLVRVSFGCSPLAHRASDMLAQIPICRCSTLQPQTYSEDCGVRLPLEGTQSRGGGPMCPLIGNIVRFHFRVQRIRSAYYGRTHRSAPTVISQYRAGINSSVFFKNALYFRPKMGI